MGHHLGLRKLLDPELTLDELSASISSRFSCLGIGRGFSSVIEVQHQRTFTHFGVEPVGGDAELCLSIGLFSEDDLNPSLVSSYGLPLLSIRLEIY